MSDSDLDGGLGDGLDGDVDSSLDSGLGSGLDSDLDGGPPIKVIGADDWAEDDILVEPDVEPSGLGIRDLSDEMVAALVDRPSRTALTALGTVLGVAALVATLGLAQTAGNQIVTRFDALEATEVTVRPGNNRDSSGNVNSVIPFDSQQRLERLNGVVSAGTITDVSVSGLARSVPINDPLGQTEFDMPVNSVSPGLFDAARCTVRNGRFFDQGHNERADAVAVLGPAAASRLNIDRVGNSPAIFLGDDATLTVIGIIDDCERQPKLLSAIIVPDEFARDALGLAAPGEVLIDTELGAAELIGGQAAIALSPNNPDLLRVSVPPSPTRVRSGVQDDVNALFLVLGGVSLLAGAIGIANVTLVSVLERTGEIGLRRALGASRRHIAAQFLAESAALGALAGVVGASVGVLIIVMVSASREWTPVISPWLPLAAPILGALIGLIAGFYPAWKAANLEPIAALRTSG